MSTIDACHIIDLGKIRNQAGNITVIEDKKALPFSVRRVFYLYDVPGGSERGGHAHKELHQLIVATAGSFDVWIDDGKNQKSVGLNRPDKGILINPGIWSELRNFSSGAICLVLASQLYDENDYIRDYDFFVNSKNLVFK